MVNKKINEWKSFEKLDEALKEELFKMNEEELYDAFYVDLAFGTGGMRGILGPGTNRMNIYTIRKANYGFGKYILSVNNENPSVVIAYDSRNNSTLFAEESAKVLANLGIKVYLFDKITPTPELSFAVRFLKATGGIVVTASHNPPIYNGYKIYDETGCQLVPDLANIVIDEIAKAPNPFDMELPCIECFKKSGLVEIIGKQVDEEYLEKVKSISVNNPNKEDFKVVFTPLHGTSSYLGERLLTECGYNVIPVKEQMVADPLFSTVVLPNPEDKRAFDLAVKYAKENGADICIATDPDADRVGLAVKNGEGYVLLTGNQTGALLIDYLVKNRKIDKKAVLFNTIVTSNLGAEIARKAGIDVFSTLTGFKFIGEQARKLEGTDKMFYFGYEESYGYVVCDFVRDKDSLQALLLCSEMSCFYKNQGKNLIEVLEEIYEEFGYYGEALVNINLAGASGAARIVRILNHFRTLEKLNSEKLIVVAKEDYELSKRIDETGESEITLPKSNVIKYFLSDGSWFALRPSGTEPKMKVYISSVGKTEELSKKRIKEIEEEVLKIVNGVE